MAAIVKMIQNALIGFVTVGITLFWLCADRRLPNLAVLIRFRLQLRAGTWSSLENWPRRPSVLRLRPRLPSILAA
eukprot:COSAG04_NODE_2426_length_4143_cov_6.064787_3_plen_75_part_00